MEGKARGVDLFVREDNNKYIKSGVVSFGFLMMIIVAVILTVLPKLYLQYLIGGIMLL